MGLGTVELVMEIEDTFDVRIPDADAERMETPNDVTDWLMEHASKPPAGVCGGARAFYALRRSMRTAFGVPRRAVRLKTKLHHLIRPELRVGWANFARENGLPRPRFWFFKSCFPDEATTVRDLLQSHNRFNPGHWRDPAGQPLREKVMAKVLQLTSEQCGVRLDDIGPDTHFIRDLYLD